MSEETAVSDPYAVVLADLRAKRDQIDQAITAITNLMPGAAVIATNNANHVAPSNGDNPAEMAGAFLGMSIVDASKKLLGMRKRAMGNPEIAKELQSGGLVLTSKEPANVIGSVLTRRFNDVGDVVKIGRGIWGLKEWYPGRNFKPANKAAAMLAEAADDPDIDTAPPEKPDVLSDPLSVEAIAAFGRGLTSATRHG